MILLARKIGPARNNLTKPMKRILSILCLTILLVSSGVCWSADFQKGLAAADRGDFATALETLTPRAEQGGANAQGILGFMYDKGLGVPQDYKAAVKWYTLAAEQGNVGAQYNLGFMYYKGQGLPQDYVRAHMWLNIAASSGDKDSVENRDIIATQMTPSQIAEAQKLARECVKKNYKGC